MARKVIHWLEHRQVRYLGCSHQITVRLSAKISVFPVPQFSLPGERRVIYRKCILASLVTVIADRPQDTNGRISRENLLFYCLGCPYCVVRGWQSVALITWYLLTKLIFFRQRKIRILMWFNLNLTDLQSWRDMTKHFIEMWLRC